MSTPFLFNHMFFNDLIMYFFLFFFQLGQCGRQLFCKSGLPPLSFWRGVFGGVMFQLLSNACTVCLFQDAYRPSIWSSGTKPWPDENVCCNYNLFNMWNIQCSCGMITEGMVLTLTVQVLWACLVTMSTTGMHIYHTLPNAGCVFHVVKTFNFNYEWLSLCS